MADEGKFFYIKSKLSGLVLDVEGQVAAPGTPVVMWEMCEQDNQLWYQDMVANVIRSKANDELVLEVQGEALVVNDYSPDEYNQKWKVAGDRVCHYDNNDYVLDIVGCSEDPGASVCAFDYNGQDNQHWEFVHISPVYFFIRSVYKEEKAIDVEKSDTDPGTKAVMYDRKPADHEEGNDNQQFWEDKYSIIHSKLSGLVMDTAADKKGRVEFHEYDADIPERQYVKSGQKICLKTDPTRVIAIKDHDDFRLFSTPKLEAVEYSGEAHQKWIFEYV